MKKDANEKVALSTKGAPAMMPKPRVRRTTVPMVTKNLKDVRDVVGRMRKALTKGHDTMAATMRRLIGEVENVQQPKFVGYRRRLEAQDEAMVEAMATRDAQKVATQFGMFTGEVMDQLAAEKADATELNRVMRECAKVLASKSAAEDQCLCMLKRISNLTAQLDVGQQGFHLSEASMRPANYIPSDQMEDIDLDGEFYASDDTFDGADEQAESRLERGEMQKFRNLIKRFENRGISTVTEADKTLVKKLHRACMILCTNAEKRCDDNRAKLADALCEFTRFLDATKTKVESTYEKVQYKHRTVTV